MKKQKKSGQEKKRSKREPNLEKNNGEEQNETLVVGLGASAGGLEALKTFFGTLPEKTGMAFIVIVHLSPKHKSSLAELLQNQTSLVVSQVNEKTKIEPDHVYVIPPGKLLLIGDHFLDLELSEPEYKDHRPEAVDLFFRSLGMVKGSKAISITLSGTGSDGAVGIKTVKEKGGLTIAQDPDEAQYDGMPQSAIRTGCVDKILPVTEMVNELMDYKKNLSTVRISDNPEVLSEDNQNVLSKIFARVRSETNHDFNHYKLATVLRRIERRMHVTRTTSLEDYLTFLNEHSDEAQELFKDLLISVTNFFRDPEAFGTLKNKIIPSLFNGKTADDDIRIWVPGCATGEEAYSIAILLYEFAENIDNPPQIQIFATDLDEEALKTARQGIYPESIVTDLTPQRLTRFFNKDGYVYTINEDLRNMVLFAKHNLLGSPPFSRVDLISCRNLLIYLNKELQGEVFNLFHYALNSDGWLFLGVSDSNLEGTDLFNSIDKQYRIYQKSSATQSKAYLPDFPLSYNKKMLYVNRTRSSKNRNRVNFKELHNMLVAREYAPPSVIINENHEVLHSSGNINQYLNYSGGQPSWNILEMVISELKHPLRNILFKIKKDELDLPFRRKLQVTRGDKIQHIELEVSRIKEKRMPDDLLYIVFEKKDIKKTSLDKKTVREDKISDEEAEITRELENELRQTKEQLQITVEDYETSNEELRASNEELQSMNEELQSTTEELETSQEELQSVNEELKTVNQELESKIQNLHRSNSDLKNLMEATEIATIFVDRDYKVKRFTARVTDIFNITSQDIGRPLEHFTHRLNYDRIQKDIHNVQKHHDDLKKEVMHQNGKCYIMQLRPYKTTADQIEGVVITFVDITDLKSAEAEIKQANTDLEDKIEQIKELQREILKNDTDDRWKIGQYLHDELAQSLLAAGLMLDHLDKDLKKEKISSTVDVDQLKEILNHSVHSVRDLSHQIVPIDLEQEGVMHAFRSLSKQISKIHEIDCNLEDNGVIDRIDNIEMATNLYRVAHEAAKNAALHGNAKNVMIALRSDDKFLYMDIDDDGTGISNSKKKESGMGINIMRHRMDLLGGTFEIKKSSDDGVRIHCSVPLNG